MVSPAETSQRPEAAEGLALQRMSSESTEVTGLLPAWGVLVGGRTTGFGGRDVELRPGEETYGSADAGVSEVLAVDPEVLEGGVGGHRRGGRESENGGLHLGW